MKQTIKFQRVSLFRRICSIIFDGIIAVCLFVVLLACVSQPIITETTDYNQIYEKYNEELMSTHLYLYYEENDAVSLISSNFDDKLTKFYNEEKLGYTSEDYYKVKYLVSDIYPENEGDILFIYNKDTDVFTENIYKVDQDGNFTTEIDSKKQALVKTFYQEHVNKLAQEVLNQEVVLGYTQKLTAYTILMFLIAVIPAILILYLLVPMLIKDGTTMGKKMLQMRVIDAKTGKDATKFQQFIRFVFFALINVMLGIFTYGLSIFVSIIMIFMSKNRQTIHDVIAGTFVVCSNFGEREKVDQNEIIEITFDDGKEDVESLDSKKEEIKG